MHVYLTAAVALALCSCAAPRHTGVESEPAKRNIEATERSIETARVSSENIGTKLERAENKNIVITEWLRRNSL